VEEFGLKRLMETRGTEKRRKHVDEFKKRVDGQNGRNGERAGQEEESAAATIAREVEKFMLEEVDV
jgi:hypothetical protein